MTLSDISIKRPVFAWMLMVGLLVFGAISYSRMGISQLPDVDFPVITITVTWAGASPEVMESAVADMIEDAVMSVDGIQRVQSVSQQGMTQITIQFNLNQDINAALEQVQTRLAQAQKNLPQTIDPPVITKTNPADRPIMWIAAYGEKNMTLRSLGLFVRDHLKDSITTVSGVGDVYLGGYVDPQMRIWLDNTKLVQHEITAEDVMNAVATEHQLSPTGYQDLGPNESYVQVHSEFTNASECEALVIPVRGGGTPIYRVIRVGDVAQCEEGTDEVRRISRYNGVEPTVGLGVIKQHGTNAVAIADQVKAKLKSLAELLPKGMHLGVVIDTTKFIRDSITELMRTLGFAVLLTSFVCYLFLGSISSALNVIIAIPVSLVGAFIFLRAFGFTVNTFTLMALTLSIGIVVDDAIMMLENITRHREQKETKVEAAIRGAREITPPAVAASIAILAIFVPVVFMEGIIGRFFFQFGIALSVAVLISLLEALTLAPMRCSQFLKVGHDNRLTQWVNRGMGALTRGYRRALKGALRFRWPVLILAFVVFGASLLIAKTLRSEFLPPQDQSNFMITLYTKMGASIQYTNSVFKKAEAFYASRKEVDHYYVAVGGFGGGLVNQGITFLTMKDPGDRPIVAPFKKAPTQQQFMTFVHDELSKIEGIDRVSILDLSLTGFSAQHGYPIEFVVQGPDWKTLTQYSEKIRSQLKDSGLMTDIDTDYNPNMPETEIYPDRLRAAREGVPVSTISNTVAAMVGGLKLLPSKYTDAAGHRDDIQIKLVQNQNRSSVDIGNIWVRNIYGQIRRLKDMVRMEKGSTLLTITRYNRERGISIYGNFPPSRSQSDVVNYIQKLGHELPKGYHITFSGNTEAFQASFRSLLFALILGIFVAYMVLASQFNSFLHPMIILLALPFSLTGALIAMKITDTSTNIYSLIGILLLMGIVKKNSILLVDFTNQKRREGFAVNEALLEACPIRLRPIVMTSIATVSGAIPEVVLRGSGSELIRPMAIAVIGGVILSTFLTLFVVPTAYSLASRLEGHKTEKAIQEAMEVMGEEFGSDPKLTSSPKKNERPS